MCADACMDICLRNADETCVDIVADRLYIGSISASPTACLLRGYARAGTQNDRLGAARAYPRNRHALGDAKIEPI